MESLVARGSRLKVLQVRILGIMEKKMETLGPFKGICRGLYRG